MKRVVYHRLAASELIESARFYERRTPLLGDAFLTEVDDAVTRFIRAPLRAKRGAHDTRSLKTKRFPFRIVILQQPDRFWIVAVAHLKRRPGYWGRRLANP
jgi:toxin ParE1/3/4